jgi:hypothetical protein
VLNLGVVAGSLPEKSIVVLVVADAPTHFGIDIGASAIFKFWERFEQSAQPHGVSSRERCSRYLLFHSERD